MVYSTIFTLFYLVPEGENNWSSQAWANKPQKVKETLPEVTCVTTIQAITSPTSTNLGLEPKWLQCQFCIPVSSVNFLPLEYCGLQNCDQSDMSPISSSHVTVQMQCQFFKQHFSLQTELHPNDTLHADQGFFKVTLLYVSENYQADLYIEKRSTAKHLRNYFLLAPDPIFSKLAFDQYERLSGG